MEGSPGPRSTGVAEIPREMATIAIQAPHSISGGRWDFPRTKRSKGSRKEPQRSIMWQVRKLRPSDGRRPPPDRPVRQLLLRN